MNSRFTAEQAVQKRRALQAAKEAIERVVEDLELIHGKVKTVRDIMIERRFALLNTTKFHQVMAESFDFALGLYDGGHAAAWLGSLGGLQTEPTPFVETKRTQRINASLPLPSSATPAAVTTALASTPVQDNVPPASGPVGTRCTG